MPKSSRTKKRAPRRRKVARANPRARDRAASRAHGKSRSPAVDARAPRTAATKSRRSASAASVRDLAIDRALRRLLVRQLEGGEAFALFAEAIRGLPAELHGVRPEGAAHSPWQVLEHLRIAQWDIVEFSRNPDHRSPAWPAGYWPESPAPPNATAWDESVREFERDLATMKQMIADPKRDLFVRIAHPEAEAHHTLAREAMVLLQHNGYHTAELVVLRRLLGAWPGG